MATMRYFIFRRGGYTDFQSSARSAVKPVYDAVVIGAGHNGLTAAAYLARSGMSTLVLDVAIHDHPRPNAYWHPDSVLAAIKGHKHIGSVADVGHWARNGLDPVTCLKELEGHIYGVHLKDITQFNNTEAPDTVVGKGVIKFDPIFQELKRQDFSGMMSIEHESNWFNSVPDVIETRKFFDAENAALK